MDGGWTTPFYPTCPHYYDTLPAPPLHPTLCTIADIPPAYTEEWPIVPGVLVPTLAPATPRMQPPDGQYVTSSGDTNAYPHGQVPLTILVRVILGSFSRNTVHRLNQSTTTHLLSVDLVFTVER
jgi:hypothetical protein